MKEWLVRLKGDESDLQELSELLYSTYATVLEKEGNYYLKSNEFNTITDTSDVLANATNLVELINGSAMVHSGKFKAIHVDGYVIGIDEDGEHQNFVHLDGTLQTRSQVKKKLTVIKQNGSVESGQQPTQVESYLALGRRDKSVADALHFFSFEKNGINLIKVYEIVKDDVGDENKIIENHWVTKKSINLFRQTACSRKAAGDNSRHAIQKHDPPKNPMSLHEAKSLISTILRDWIRSKKV